MVLLLFLKDKFEFLGSYAMSWDRNHFNCDLTTFCPNQVIFFFVFDLKDRVILREVLCKLSAAQDRFNLSNALIERRKGRKGGRYCTTYDESKY